MRFPIFFLKHKASLSSNLLSFLQNASYYLLIFSLIFNPFVASASEVLPIVADGTTNTQVTKTASGVDQINIAAPNSSGLSHNRFTHYNVNESGQIINNFSGRNPSEVVIGSGASAVTSTQIGGLVTTNQNLINSGSARVILNEVTSSSNTQLRGYTEIAGTKADLIIANSNGITCVGCGFINTSRLAFIAGSRDADINGNLAFKLKEQSDPNLMVPLITISGLGLDVENVTATEIIASSIKLISTIYAGDNSVTLKSGDGKFNYQSKELTSNPSPQPSSPRAEGEEMRELFAIDASNLGAIQAGRIFIIATKDGLGVNMDADLNASKSLNIDSAGNLYYSNISAPQIEILSKKSITQKADSKLVAHDYSNPNNKDVKAKISAEEGFTNLGIIYSSNEIDIYANNSIDNHDLIYSLGNLTLKTNNSEADSSLTNHNLAQIYSESDLTIDSANVDNRNTLYGNKVGIFTSKSLNNSASAIIESGTNLTIKNLGNFGEGGSINNQGIISANNKLTINSTSGTITNSESAYLHSNSGEFVFGDANSLEDPSSNASTTNSAILNNYGQITSNSAINISSNLDQFTNQVSGKINSGDFSLTINDFSKEFTNYGKIETKDILTLNIANIFNNYGSVKADKSANITADTLNNNGENSYIKSKLALTISAKNINNQNSKGDDLLANSGIVSTNGSITINSNNINNDNGLIQGRGVTTNVYNAEEPIIISNISGSFAAVAESVIFNLLTSDYNFTGEITAADFIEINANNITNSEHNIITSDYIKLNAIGTITNGTSGADNSNVSLAAGTYFEATAANIINYGTLSAQTKLTLTTTSGSIDNYGTITGGEEETTITTAQNFNNLTNNSKLTAAQNLNLNVANDLNNNGEISVKENLTANATNLNNNSSALIWSNQNATFNINNNLINTSAVIYSEGNLTIQNNLGGKNNLIKNKGGDIESFSGDVTLRTKSLINEKGDIASLTAFDREEFEFIHKDTNDTPDPSDDVVHGGHAEGGPFFQHLGYHARLNLNRGRFNDGYQITIGGLTHPDHRAGIDRTVYLQKENPNLDRSTISSGGNMFIYADSITNDLSNIYSDKNLYLEGLTLDNKASQIISRVKYQCHHGSEFCSGGGFSGRAGGGASFEFNKVTGVINSYIKSGGSFTGSFRGRIDNETVVENANVSPPDQKFKETDYSKINSKLFLNDSVVVVDLSEILTALNNANPNESETNSGSLKLNLNPNSNKPLTESRSIFTNKDKFFGSEYFYNAMGLDGKQMLNTLNNINAQQNRMLGDAFAETKLIAQQLKQIRQDALLLSDNETNTNSEIKSLLDDSIAEFKRLNLSLEDVALNGLTQSQINSLDKDIITFEATNINGMSIIAPKLYLSINTKNKLLNNNSLATNGATIYAKDNLTITAGNINASGSITSGNNLTLNSSDKITLSNASLSSKNKTILNAVNDINVSNDQLPTISTTQLSSNLSNLRLLKTLSSASPTISTSSIKDEAANARSALTFNAGTDIELNSSGNINISSSQTNAGGSIFLTAAGNITNSNYQITAGENVVMNATNINNISTANTATQAALNPTKITAGSIVSLNATKDSEGNGGNINNIGATIKGGDLVYLTAENNVNNLALINYSINGQTTNKDQTITSGSAKKGTLTTTTISGYTTDSQTGLTSNAITQEQALASNARNIKSTLIAQGSIESGGNVVIVAGNNLNNKASNITSAESTYLEATDGNINIETAALRDRTVKTTYGKKNTSTTRTSDNTNNLESNITAGTSGSGSLELLATSSETSGSDTSGNINIKGSDLTSADNLTLTAANDINITSAKDTSFFQANGRIGKGKSFLTRRESTTNIESNLTTTNNGNITITAGEGNTDEVGNPTSKGNLTIIASNLTTKDTDNNTSNNQGSGNVNLTARNELLVGSDVDTSYSESSYSKKGLTVFKNSISIKQDIINVKSNIDASGDLNTNSGSDTNLIGTEIAATNATLNVGGELNIFAVQDQHYSFEQSTKTRNFSAITKAISPLLAPAADFFKAVPVPMIGNTVIYADALLNGDFSSKSNLSEKSKIINQGSDIVVQNNLTINADKDINIAGSNLSGGGSAEINSNNGNINIYNVKDVDYTRSESRKSKTTWSSFVAGSVQVVAANFSDAMTSINVLKTPDQKQDSIKENNEASANVPQKTNININISSNETIIASNLSFTGNINLNADKNTNLTSSNLTSESGNVNINSGDSTTINTDTEKDYTYTFNHKKTPSIAAAISNSIVKIANDAMPSFGHSKSDNTKSNNDINELVYDQDKFKKETTTNTNIASNITSNLGDISITSNNNNLISGSNLSSGRNINLTSTTGSTIITSAADQKTVSTEDINQEYNKISGNYNRGRTSLDSESSVVEQTTTTTTTTQKQSTISAGNNIAITSNKDLNILSSDLTAGSNPTTSDTATSGTINLTSREGNVNVLALADTVSTTTETKTGTLTLSAGVGNTVVDTAYAEYDVIQAAKAVADAKKNLNHMETLEKNGQASSEAVEDAKINLAISVASFALAELKLAASAAKVAGSAGTLGFYADLKLSIDGSKTNTNSNSSTAVASNIKSNGNLVISSGMSLLDSNSDLIAGTVGNTTITGSNIISNEGDINITSKNNTVINASKDTYNSSAKTNTWSENITLGSTIAGGKALDDMIKAAQISLGLAMSKSKSDTASTTYNNSQLTARNGSINITSNGTTSTPDGSQSGGDTTIKGANILGKDVTITSNGNLSVESKQNSYTEKGKSFGLNLGGGSGSVSAGINYSSNKTDRLWTDNQTSILGTNSITINTANNTNIKGAVIANITNTDDLNNGNGVVGYNMNSITLADAIDGGNLTLNTKSLTSQNLQDHHITENFGAGFSTSIGTGLSSNTNGGANPNPIQNLNFYPTGSTTLSLQNGSTKKEGTTFATLGNGTINLNGTTLTESDIATNPELATLNRDITKTQEITKDQITGALDASVTIDNRLLVAAYEGLTGEKDKIQNDPTLTDKEKEAKIAALQSSVLNKELNDLPKNLGTHLDLAVRLPKELYAEANEAALKVYDKLYPNEIADPKIRSEVREAIRQAALTGDMETLKTKVKELTNKTPSSNDLEAITALSKERDFAELQDKLGVISYNRFLDKYTLSTGVFFDGTGNDMARDYSSDPSLNEETNVARMKKMSDSRNEPIYIAGVGTSGGLDIFCQGLGCGDDNKQLYVQSELLKKTINNDANKEFLFFPIDVVSFSRGATTGSDFINKINNENYWNLGLLTRSHLMFDPVGSYEIPGNGIDVGRDFSTPLNVIAIQINAANEQRNLFDLQYLKSSDGTLASKNWKEITLPGAHADIGGSYPEGYQGKTQDMAFYSMQTMINEAEKYGINFKEIPTNQRPSPEFNQLMDRYNQAQAMLNSSPSQQNKTYFNAIDGLIKGISTHDSTFGGTGKIYNYSIGGERGAFYPNDKYLNDSTKLQTSNNN